MNTWINDGSRFVFPICWSCAYMCSTYYQIMSTQKRTSLLWSCSSFLLPLPSLVLPGSLISRLRLLGRVLLNTPLSCPHCLQHQLENAYYFTWHSVCWHLDFPPLTSPMPPLESAIAKHQLTIAQTEAICWLRKVALAKKLQGSLAKYSTICIENWQPVGPSDMRFIMASLETTQLLAHGKPFW